MNSLSLGILDIMYSNFLNLLRKKTISLPLPSNFIPLVGVDGPPISLIEKLHLLISLLKEHRVYIGIQLYISMYIFLLRYGVISCIDFGPNIYNNLFHWNMSYHDNTFIY